MERRYDIDWLRVIAIGLLLIYHLAIVFQPWGVFIGFIQSDVPMEGLWPPMAMLNVWRIPLLFFVSGMGVYFALQKRNLKTLLLERTRRILVPLLFGMVFIVPVHLFIWQKYYNQAISYKLQPGHLWFLANIFIYVLVLAPLFIYLHRHASRINFLIRKIMPTPLGFLVIAGTCILETTLLRPDTYELYALTWHGFFLGMLAFFFGFVCMQSGEAFWQNLKRWKWIFLTSSILLYLIRYLVFDMNAPYYLMATETISWIYSMLGLGYAYLNRPGKLLSYLSQGAYPIYILHMIFLYLASYFIIPLHLPATATFLLILGITFAGCFIFYEFLIRRVKFLRPLFGLKLKWSASK